MIDTHSFSHDWISGLRNQLGKRSDPKLIEKVVHALYFLEQLKANGLTFLFKGGTALLLATDAPTRFSIDIDIITQHDEADIANVLGKIIAQGRFLKWEDDNARTHSADAPLGHFKVFYQSVIDGQEEPVLLDVLYAKNPYPQWQTLAIKHNWIANSGEPETIEMPTFDAILGDKLTAFAPKTTGILYAKNRHAEIIKQLFDIAFLFDRISNLEMVKASYNRIVAEERRFRKLDLSPDDVLNDTLEACFTLSERDSKNIEFNYLQTGIRNFTNFSLQPFHIEEAIKAAAKVAYLVSLLKSDGEHIERYGKPTDVKDWRIENQEYTKLNKLKKTNPEAFYYWYRALHMG